MDVKLLRTLAWKSSLGFGKYSDLSIQQIYDLRHTEYLRWCYYSINGISFNEDILRKIGILSDKFDYRIKKPGIDLEIHEKLLHINFNRRCKIKNATHIKNANKIGAKIKMVSVIMYDNIYFSKGNLQRRNHGH